MELDFDKKFFISTGALKLNRSHPYIPRDKKWLCQFLSMHGIFFTATFLAAYNIIYHDLKGDNFPQTCKNGVLVVVFIVITTQYIILLVHQSDILELINDMKTDFREAKNLSSEEQNIVSLYADKGLYVSKQWLVLNIVGVSLFLFKTWILMAYYYWIDEFRLVCVYDFRYPLTIENKVEYNYLFSFTYFVVFFFSVYCAIMYVAFVPLGPIFMLHACGQLALVKRRVEDLFVECDAIVIKGKLKFIIQRMQYIYSFVDRTKECFKVAYELTLKGTTIILPITFYEVLEALNDGEVDVEFIVFIVGGIMISSAPCYYSNLLMDKGEEVRQSIYSCGWELYYDRATRSTLQLMLQRAVRPVAIQTIFRILCLDALTDLFQQSYALFNLMNTMWD